MTIAMNTVITMKSSLSVRGSSPCPHDSIPWTRADLLSQGLYLGAMFEEGTGETLPFEQMRTIPDGAQKGRSKGGEEAPLANILPSKGREGTRLNVALGVDVE